MVDQIDLAQVTEPRFVLHGYWDGPRHQLFSVTGTLHVWLDVRPWPAESMAAQGCDAKAKAYVDKKYAMEVGFFNDGDYSRMPIFETFSRSFGSARALGFRNSYDRNAVSYVIPIDGGHFLNLIIESVGNSDPSAGWTELSAREEGKFLQSLELVGNNGDCR